MKDLIFEHFVPITWEPGHMGAFLANFLTPKLSCPVPLSQQGGMLPNKEWFFVDCFLNFFGSDSQPNRIYDSIKKELDPHYSGVELIEMIAIDIVKGYYHSFTEKSDLTFDMLKNSSSRYIKEHPYKESHYNFSEIVWKNKKIYCRFPYEKLWIPHFLLEYKYGPNDQEFIDIVNRHKERNEYPWPDLVPPTEATDHITFDIYDLIFNKNLDQVYNIDPTFDFDDDKKAMLDLAYNSSLEILDLFGLDHNWSIDHTTKTKDILNKPTKDPGFILGRPSR